MPAKVCPFGFPAIRLVWNTVLVPLTAASLHQTRLPELYPSTPKRQVDKDTLDMLKAINLPNLPGVQLQQVRGASMKKT